MRKFVTAGSYQLQSGDFRVVPQIISEIQIFHRFKHESKGVVRGGINRDERHELFATVVETTTHQRFPIHPLYVTSDELNLFGSAVWRLQLTKKADKLLDEESRL